MSEINQRSRERDQGREQVREEAEKLCRVCSHINVVDAMFCEECGKSFDTPERSCPVCGETGYGECCEFCGSSIEGRLCGKCNSLQYHDFCETCGEPLSSMAMDALRLADVPAEMKVVEESEAFAIINDLRESITSDTMKEQERKRQKMMFLFEKAYREEREQRIEAFRASLGVQARTVSSEEMKTIKRSVENLKDYVDSENRRIDEEIRRVEEERKRAEEQRQKEEAESKRIELQRLKEEKRRKEQELYNNRINGVWVSRASWVEIMKLQYSGNKLTGSSHWIIGDRECVFTLEGTWDGRNFFIKSTGIRDIAGRSGHFTFCGTVDNSGNVLTGYFIDNTKEKNQQVFIKQ